MATKRIETQLSIKAVDQYSSVLKGMRTVTGRFADGVRTEMSNLQGMRGPLRMIEDFRKQQQVVARSGESLQQARERVRQLRHAITTTRNPTAQMRREFERARTTADRLEQQHRQNRRALSGLQGQLRQAGVNTGDLAGEQRRLSGALDGATTAFGRQIEKMQRIETMQTRIAEARERMDRSLATAANLNFAGMASMQTGRRILTALSGPIQGAIAFESAMSDVRKVVDFDTPEAFAQMSDDVLELSTRIPVAAEGLAQILAAGGQSSLSPDELLPFTEAAAKIGVAFDISADHAGTSLAKIKTALGLTLDETVLLFDGINHLSNNLAATAPDVLNFTTRVAVDGEVKGFSATETMAFGSAMIASGANAEVAATSFRNMGKALARGESATDRQKSAYEALGLSAVDVAQRLQEDAVGTTLDVMERINEVPAHLRSSLLSDLFGDEARALAPLISKLDLLRESLGLVSDEQDYLGSAEREYAERAKTTANNLQLMRNQMARLGVSIGEVVLPPLNDLLEMSQGVIERVVTWTKEHPKLTKWLVIGAAAVGGLAVAGGALLTAAGALIGTMAVLRFGLVGLGARAIFAGGEIASLAAGVTRAGRSGSGLARIGTSLAAFTSSRAGAMRGVTAALRGIAGVTGLRVVATGLTALVGVVGTISAPIWIGIAAAVAAVGAAWKYWDRISSIVSGVASAIGERLQPVLEAISPVLEFLPPVIDGVKTAFSGIGNVISDVVTAIQDFFSGDLFSREVLDDEEKARLEASAAEMTGKIIDGIASGISGVFQLGRDIIVSLWDGALAEFASFIEWVRSIPSLIVDAIGSIDLSGIIDWPEPPRWWNYLFGEEEVTVPQPAVTDAPGFDQLPAAEQAAAETVVSVTQSGPLPTPAHLQELRDYATGLRDEIAAIQGEIDNLGQGPMADTMAMPLRQTMDARRRDLREVEAELSNTEGRAGDLATALQVIHGTEVAPEIGTASIERANDLIAQMLANLRAASGAEIGATVTPQPAGARARGGPVRTGLPYLVNENTPRSEWFVPSQSGGILNVGQAQSALRSHLSAFAPRPISRNPDLARLHRGAQGLRAASLAVLTSSALAAPAAAQPAQAARPGPGAVTVQIENFTVHVPSGVSDPDAIADLVSDRIGQRVSATLSASFSD